jgi:RNA polymerase subunit RPABC4/transcription elongation factor Spt4
LNYNDLAIFLFCPYFVYVFVMYRGNKQGEFNMRKETKALDELHQIHMEELLMESTILQVLRDCGPEEETALVRKMIETGKVRNFAREIVLSEAVIQSLKRIFDYKEFVEPVMPEEMEATFHDKMKACAKHSVDYTMTEWEGLVVFDAYEKSPTGNWKKIKDAPKDGTLILVTGFDCGDAVMGNRWIAGAVWTGTGWGRSVNDSNFNPPTHYLDVTDEWKGKIGKRFVTEIGVE